jgi:hypothetical protein
VLVEKKKKKIMPFLAYEKRGVTIAVKVKDKWNVYKDGKQSFEVLVVDAEVNFFFADVLFAHFIFMFICSKFSLFRVTYISNFK